MKAQAIVDQLSAALPLYTAGFSDAIAISSITVVGTTATATTSAAHNLANGDNVAIIGALAPVQIDIATFLRTGSTATFDTLQDHDFTLSERDKANGGKTLTISGATEAEFNGTFTILSAPNRNRLIIAVTDAGPTTISGSPIVEDANGGIFDGLFPVSNVTTNTFDYTLPIAYTLPAVVDNAFAQVSIRIVSVLSIRQYLDEVYTRQAIGADHLVVQLGDVTISKKRNEESDAASSSSGEDSYTPLLIQTFAVYIVMNVTNQLTATQARDQVEDEYIPAIFRSIYRAQFDTGFTYSDFRTTFTGHGAYEYYDVTGKNKAIYVHELTFEQLAKLTKADTVGPVTDVAMRDFAYTLTTNLGTGELTADINLDESP